jgi:hypothetical protein
LQGSNHELRRRSLVRWRFPVYLAAFLAVPRAFVERQKARDDGIIKPFPPDAFSFPEAAVILTVSQKRIYHFVLQVI